MQCSENSISKSLLRNQFINWVEHITDKQIHCHDINRADNLSPSAFLRSTQLHTGLLKRVCKPIFKSLPVIYFISRWQFYPTMISRLQWCGLPLYSKPQRPTATLCQHRRDKWQDFFYLSQGTLLHADFVSSARLSGWSGVLIYVQTNP